MTEERTERKRRGIGQLVWPLLLACLLLALWLSYWQNFDPFNWGSNAEVEMTPVSEEVTITDGDGSTDADVEADADADADVADQPDEDPEAANTVADKAEGDETEGDADADVSDAGSAASVDDGSDDGASDSSNADADSTANGVDGAGEGPASDAAAASDAMAASFALALNSQLRVVDAAADSADGGLRLFATAAQDSPIREIYNPGDEFVLIEPGEDFDAYPVEVDGVSWVRVRDQDGLLGWADLSLLASE